LFCVNEKDTVLCNHFGSRKMRTLPPAIDNLQAAFRFSETLFPGCRYEEVCDAFDQWSLGLCGLIRVHGAVAPGTPFANWGEKVQECIDHIRRTAVTYEKSVEVGKHNAVYHQQATFTGHPCQCRTAFGGDKHFKYEMHSAL